MKDHVNAVHGARCERSAVWPPGAAERAVERVDVLSVKRLERKIAEFRNQVVVDDALGVSRGRWGPVRGHRLVPVDEELLDSDL